MSDDIPPEDKQLITDLDAIRETLRLAADIFTKRAKSCACDGEMLCAHHAQVYSHLATAALAIERAQDQLRRE